MALAIVKEWKATRMTVGTGRVGSWRTSKREANDGRLDDGRWGDRNLLPLNLLNLIR